MSYRPAERRGGIERLAEHPAVGAAGAGGLVVEDNVVDGQPGRNKRHGLFFKKKRRRTAVKAQGKGSALLTELYPYPGT